MLSEEDIRASARSNGDGGGMAYIKDNKVVVEKGFMKVDDFLERYNKVVAEGATESPMLVHFRIATTGAVNKDNCHPFIVGRGEGNGAVVHNGWFYSGGRNAVKSDTRVVVERQRNNLSYDAIRNSLVDLEKEITGSNKLAFLFDDGKYVIVNEDRGTWHDGIWYSNSWFKPHKDKSPLSLVPSNSCPISGGPDI